MGSDQDQDKGTGDRAKRRALFGAAAFLLGLVPLVACELALRLGGWGRVTEIEAPFISFSEVRPLFVLNSDAGRYEIARSRLVFFQPASFAATRGPRTCRIFCLGGSTVQGRPYGVETSFTTWLRLGLTAADPATDWEVVNCGGASYASYRLVPIMRELLRCEPDLFIIYTGHNEFLEDRTYAAIKRRPRAAVRAQALLSGLRTYGVCRAGWLRLKRGLHPGSPAPVAELPGEVDALLDYQDGLAGYRRDDDWRRDVIEHFRLNLESMVRLARDADVPVILVNPAANLKDCPPFKVQHRDGLTAGELARFEQLRAAAAALPWDAVRRKLELLEQAVALDERHAGVLYQAGKCCEALNLMAAARGAFAQAREEDVCPLRILAPMHEAILEVGRAAGVRVVDVRRAFEELSPGGIPGKELLVDHVHPTIRGRQLVADALFRALVELRFVRPPADWAERRQRLWQQHIESLPDTYFAHGLQRLERLRKWTQGRGLKTRGEGAGRPERQAEPAETRASPGSAGKGQEP